jgi:hypothetical protein
MIAKPAVAVAKPSRSFELHQLAAPMIHKLSIELVARADSASCAKNQRVSAFEKYHYHNTVEENEKI